MQFSLNNQQMIHVLSEAIVLIGITFYFSTRVKYIEKKLILQSNRINDLENIVEQQGKFIKMIINKLSNSVPEEKIEELNDEIKVEEEEENMLKKRQEKLIQAVKSKNKKKVQKIKIEPESENKIEEIIEEEDEEEENEDEENEEEENEEEENEEEEDLQDPKKLEKLLHKEIKNLN